MQNNLRVNRLFSVGMAAWKESSIHRPLGTECYFLSPKTTPVKSLDKMILIRLRAQFQGAVIEEVLVSEFVGDPLPTGTNNRQRSVL